MEPNAVNPNKKREKQPFSIAADITVQRKELKRQQKTNSGLK